MSVVYILLLIFASFDVLSSAPTWKEPNDGLDENKIKILTEAKVLNLTLYKEARRDFIVFHLRRGYEILNDAVTCNFKELIDEIHKRGCEYSMQFYISAVECCSIRTENNLNLPKDVICFDDGHCIDIGDPGIHPDRP